MEDRIVPANYTVTGLGDAGAGMGNSGDLRYCINQADQQFGNSTITFQGGMAGTIDLNSSLSLGPAPGVMGPVAIDIKNVGGLSLIIVERSPNAQGNFPLFNIGQGAKVSIQGLTIQKGVAAQGGAIYDASNGVTLTNDVVSGNQSTGDGGAIWALRGVILDNTIVSGNTAGGNGGGIFVSSPLGLTIQNGSMVSGNTAQGSGGGVYYASDAPGANDALIQQSTISGNTAKTGDGGDIWNASTGSQLGFTIQQSTIAGNTAMGTGKGGGLYNAGLATLINSTLNGNTANLGGATYTPKGGGTVKINVTEAGNTAKGAGGGAAPNLTSPDSYSPGIGGGSYVEDGGVEELINTIIANNNADDGSPDVFGNFISDGSNLIGIVDGSTGWNQGSTPDLTGTGAQPLDPMLNVLGYYGGPTMTMPLQHGSPALGAGDPNVDPNLVGTVDQRGAPRFVNGLIDIGAVEMPAGW